MIKKIIIALILIGAITGAYVYFFMINKSHPDYEHMDADMQISAQDLFSDCRNGNAAHYTGELLEVSGAPSNIEINDSLVVLVYAFDEGMFGPEGVRATLLKSYNDKAKSLESASNITIKAFCTGYNDSDVILEKASIVKP